MKIRPQSPIDYLQGSNNCEFCPRVPFGRNFASKLTTKPPRMATRAEKVELRGKSQRRFGAFPCEAGQRGSELWLFTVDQAWKVLMLLTINPRRNRLKAPGNTQPPALMFAPQRRARASANGSGPRRSSFASSPTNCFVMDFDAARRHIQRNYSKLNFQNATFQLQTAISRVFSSNVCTDLMTSTSRLNCKEKKR